MRANINAFAVGLIAWALSSFICEPANASPEQRSDAGKGRHSMDVDFAGAGGFMLHGALVLPASEKPAPALLLIPGSGPTDRDGNQPPALMTDLLKQLADRLATDGFATLRFDKRASHVYANAWPKDLASQNSFFAWSRFTEDAAKAFKFLRTRPGIDKTRVGILGHSEGGIIALSVASELRGAERPAALVLAGTPGRTLSAVVHNQVADALTRQSATPDQVKFFIDKTDSIIQEVIRTGKVPADVPAGLAALFPPSAAIYLQAVLPLDPRDLVQKTSGPVLVLNGEKDIQVSPEKDTRPLADALKGRKESAAVEVIIVPGASHNLKDAAADPAGFTGPIAPSALDKISAWLKAHLAG